MPTAHISVDSEKSATRICDWARNARVEHYVAPKSEEHGRAMADHVTLVDLTDEQLATVQEWLLTNGLSTEIEVE